ncbi:uncharacterized protein LOC120904127 isoform X2 [Anopheles arabiensis]|uniref:uncharacterized protein LOC120904127 isoform X2 n=1 Tax=Anopheles arabiensis TaxID=7173 RepID=UPI001AAE107C|nr:uncharacterized protein LOC120904127 isoform X2 [Anopheles arabiensis]XP_040169846.1 uncharacterized protein LOC120904127 isoform X2 [Anopheles arabiensis]
MDANIEDMDISFGDVNIHGGSDVIVDEELLDGPDHKTIYDQEPDLSDSRNSATTVNSNASNTTIVMGFNRSFPANNADTVSESIRFPLQDAKDSNIPNIMQRDAPSIESVKANLLNTPAYVGFLLPDKENLIAEACESLSNSFPTAIEEQSDEFPLDVIEFAPVQIPVHHSSAPQEKFVPANEYIFSPADFDCLLSRGCSQSTRTTDTSIIASALSSSDAVLPRNSVLINFDPLLRRQTIIKTENQQVANSITETSSACPDLVKFAQHEQSNEIDYSLTDFDASYKDCTGEHSAFISNGLILPSLSLLENHPGNDPKDKQHQENALRCLLDTSLAASSTQSQELSVDSLEKTVVTQKIESANCSKYLDNLLSSSNPNSSSLLEQEKSYSEKEKNNELLVPVVNAHIDSVNFLEHNSVFNSSTDSNADPKNTQFEELIVEQFHDRNIDVSLSKNKSESEVTIKNTIFELNSIGNLATDVNVNDDLRTFREHMLFAKTAELLLVKQNRAVQNMSEERSGPIEEGCVDDGKINNTDEMNIADLEKKMHDVELREESMLKRITEKDKTISKMSNVVEAYERTIAELISEKEILIRNHEIECDSLKQDNEINAQHLESLEKTFSNLYAKYERMKKNAIKYKENEEKLVEKVVKLEECLRAQEQRYEKMKCHAMSQLEIANTKIDEAIRNHSQESAKLKAQIKKEELYRISINEQLIQKSKENEELVKICDELISETN